MWDWRFLTLIFASSLADYFLGLSISKTQNSRQRKILLSLSLIFNLSLLGFFKYFNFFMESFNDLVSSLGYYPSNIELEIILPVGISFYTFQTLSYTIDVYRKKIDACKDPITFFVFVSFFPQLVAGPIERASNLIKQFQKKNSFDVIKAYKGFEQIFWGLFKKVVIADQAALLADEIFANYTQMGSLTLFLGCIFFSIQIYGDFSGYSDMAIGIAKLFNIDLMVNFKKPYFSRDIGEFWRRWHISLSTWFRDYVYIPLGGTHASKFLTIRNILIVFLVSGLWHGADKKFLLWGMVHALLLIILIIYDKHKIHKSKDFFKDYSDFEFIKMFFTFCLVSLAWIPFRAESLLHAQRYFIKLFSFEAGKSLEMAWLPFFVVFFIIEWYTKDQEYPLENHKNENLKMAFLFIVIMLILNFGEKLVRLFISSSKIIWSST
jgi:alginate O-acetyltransferase complex protein AlgI